MIKLSAHKEKYIILGILLYAVVSVFLLPISAHASSTYGSIVSSANDGFGWSDQAGWINFGDASGDIHIQDSGITGHAWSTNQGWINMNPPTGGISVAGNGQLSGFAWGTGVGWIDFGNVRISSTGHFSGTATGDVIGTVSFDCSTCFVDTDYVPADFRVTATPPASIGSAGIGSLSGLVAKVPIASPNTPTSQPPSSSIIPTSNPPDVGEGVMLSEISNLESKIPEQLFDIDFSIGWGVETLRTFPFWMWWIVIILSSAICCLMLWPIFMRKIRYICPICHTEYREKEWAEKCEAWCREHNSCNLDIVANGV